MEDHQGRDQRDERPHGFAAMARERQRDIASKGGKAAHEQRKAHEFDADEARAAGKKGGERVSRDREHMAAIGRKGGARVSQNREHMAAIGRRGGKAVSADREHMAKIGKKGGTARAADPVEKEPPATAPDSTPPANDGHERHVA